MQANQSATASSVTGNDRLSPPDAAALIGVRPRTLSDWRSRQFGPSFIKLSKHVYYRRSEIERWLTERERAPATVTSTGGAAT